MTIKEVRQAKEELRDSVRDLFDKFKQDTGLCVTGCMVQVVETSLFGPKGQLKLCSVDVEIESI